MNRQWGAFHLQCLRMPTHITTIGLHTQARDQTSGLCNRIENKLWLSFSLTHTQTLIFPLLWQQRNVSGLASYLTAASTVFCANIN